VKAWIAIASLCSAALAAPAPAADSPSGATEAAPAAKPKLDRSGKKKRGKASFYARSLSGKPMADGTPLDPQSNAAASRTLPLGTTAEVTNLDTGRSAVVEIRDRGPYVEGRTLDVTPATARELGITQKKGVAPIVVKPIAVPQPDGSMKKGDGASP
jgi:rare lipoprotein A